MCHVGHADAHSVREFGKQLVRDTRGVVETEVEVMAFAAMWQNSTVSVHARLRDTRGVATEQMDDRWFRSVRLVRARLGTPP